MRIRKCVRADFETMYSIINEAASAYKNVIPSDRWKDPYMPRTELEHEIDEGVHFYGYEENGKLLGIMGIQDVADVSLIRHSYVRTSFQHKGIGSRLLSYVCKQTTKPVLIGTWTAATWAIRFYEKHGFQQVAEQTKGRLLRKYWSIPERQVEASVVLVDKNWKQ